MARIFITGSADGLGQLAASALIAQGHQVVLHARNENRARDMATTVRGAAGTLIADLSSMQETKRLAADVNKKGAFDAIIHNAGVYQVPPTAVSADGLPLTLAVNTFAPYILTCLINKPARLIYLSSGLHRQSNDNLDDLDWKKRRWEGYRAYADSKLHNVILAFAAARKWKEVYANALEPGWVATKMGGPGAPDSLEEAPKTQAWLAVSNDPGARVSGKYFYHMRQSPFNPLAKDEHTQEKFLRECEKLSGVTFQTL